jgi:hypothetical protein
MLLGSESEFGRMHAYFIGGSRDLSKQVLPEREGHLMTIEVPLLTGTPFSFGEATVAEVQFEVYRLAYRYDDRVSVYMLDAAATMARNQTT